nr:MAG TPA: hypothetical protein [Bacteriophage sp.]
MPIFPDSFLNLLTATRIFTVIISVWCLADQRRQTNGLIEYICFNFCKIYKLNCAVYYSYLQ